MASSSRAGQALCRDAARDHARLPSLPLWRLDPAQDVEEIVVTSALIDSTEITNPLYVINGDEIVNDATTSLGDAIDGYLGISMADYGAAVGQPIIRGMSGPRVKILKNGMVNRDVSGLGVDHLNDVDLNDIQQIEIVKGPSSLLYANGTIGGIINVVDDCIAAMNFEIPEVKIGYETQSVNDGSSEFVNSKRNMNGPNRNFLYKNSDRKSTRLTHSTVLSSRLQSRPPPPPLILLAPPHTAPLSLLP